MKRTILSIVTAMLLLVTSDPPGEVQAGPNEGGVLIVALAEGTVYTSSVSNYCGTSTATSCTDAVVSRSITEGWTIDVLNVIAAFPNGSSPRLLEVAFGLSGAFQSLPTAWGSCGDSESPFGDWPIPGSGVRVSWASAQTSTLTEVYWIAAYTDSYILPAQVQIAPHPGGNPGFRDDSIPSVDDEIAGFGAFGFNTEGSCPGPLGACCYVTGGCALLAESECIARCGDFRGADTSCEENSCAADIPAHRSGVIDRLFPQFTFCPIQQENVLFFQAEAPDARVTFLANNNRFIDGSWAWNATAIDNVFVVPQSLYADSLGVPTAPEGQFPYPCYQCRENQEPTFVYENLAILGALPFADLFDTDPLGDPNARGWDLGDRATFQGGFGAPRFTATYQDPSGGSLLLSADDGAQCADTLRAALDLAGLTVGETYALTCWWTSAADIELCDVVQGDTLSVAWLEMFVEPLSATEAPAPVVPGGLGLVLGASPNPATSSAVLEWQTDLQSRVVITIYDALGRDIWREDLGSLPPGSHQYRWDGIKRDGQPVPSGTYYYQVSSGDRVDARRVVFLR